MALSTTGSLIAGTRPTSRQTAAVDTAGACPPSRGTGACPPSTGTGACPPSRGTAIELSKGLTDPTSAISPEPSSARSHARMSQRRTSLPSAGGRSGRHYTVTNLSSTARQALRAPVAVANGERRQSLQSLLSKVDDSSTPRKCGELQLDAYATGSNELLAALRSRAAAISSRREKDVDDFGEDSEDETSTGPPRLDDGLKSPDSLVSLESQAFSDPGPDSPSRRRNSDPAQRILAGAEGTPRREESLQAEPVSKKLTPVPPKDAEPPPGRPQRQFAANRGRRHSTGAQALQGAASSRTSQSPTPPPQSGRGSGNSDLSLGPGSPSPESNVVQQQKRRHSTVTLLDSSTVLDSNTVEKKAAGRRHSTVVSPLTAMPPQEAKIDGRRGSVTSAGVRRRASWASVPKAAETVAVEFNGATVGFSAMKPENSAPLVKSLGTAERSDVLSEKSIDIFDTYVVNSEVLLTSGLDKQELESGVNKLNGLMKSGKTVYFFTSDARYSQKSLARKLRDRGVQLAIPGEAKGADEKSSSEPSRRGGPFMDSGEECEVVAPEDCSVISVGRTVASYLKAHKIKKPFVITSQSGILEDLRAAGIEDYVATIDDGGCAMEAYHKPITETRIADLLRDDIEVTIIGNDQDLTHLKVAMAATYLQVAILKEGVFNMSAPVITCCSSDMKRRWKALSVSAACQKFDAGFDLDMVGFESRIPSALSELVFSSSVEVGGYGINWESAVMIGSNCDRDIEFANRVGMKSVLICGRLANLSADDRAESRRPTWMAESIAGITGRQTS